MVQEEIPVMDGQFWKSRKSDFFWPWIWYMTYGPYIWSLDMVYALGTWYIRLGHGTCPWDMVHALGTCSARATCDLSMVCMDCMGWTAWTAWDGLHGPVIFGF